MIFIVSPRNNLSVRPCFCDITLLVIIIRLLQYNQCMGVSKCTVMDLDCPPPQLRSCACSNVVGLLGALLAFCLYCYSFSILHKKELCVYVSLGHEYGRHSSYGCPGELLQVSVFLLSNFSFLGKIKIER